MRVLVKEGIFFPGLIVMILGALILVYDIPQLMFIESLTLEDLQFYEIEELERFQRVQAEFYVGVGLLITGASLMLFAKIPVGIAKK